MRINNRDIMKVKTQEGKIEQVANNRYLGSTLTEDWRSDTDIKTRIAMEKEAFNKNHLLCRNMDFYCFEKKSC